VARVVELSFGRGGLTLERFGQVVLPEGSVRDGEVVDSDPVAHCIRQLWSATGYSHKKVVVGVANQRVIVRQLELPWMPREELRASLPFQVQDFLPMPTEQAVLDFFPLEERSHEAGAGPCTACWWPPPGTPSWPTCSAPSGRGCRSAPST
jgi:type IV pilus assembly protein PilM